MTRKLLIAWLVLGTILMVAGIAVGERISQGQGGPWARTPATATTAVSSSVVPSGHNTSDSAVCKISRAYNSRVKDCGTCVYVAGSRKAGIAYALAANHVIASARGPVTVHHKTGKLPGRILGSDPQGDLALIGTAYPEGLELHPLADADPQTGQEVWHGGYEHAGPMRAAKGKVVKWYKSGYTFELTTGARDGASGGPVLDTSGRLVGILWGSNGRTWSMATSVTRIKQRFPILRALVGVPPSVSVTRTDTYTPAVCTPAGSCQTCPGGTGPAIPWPVMPPSDPPPPPRPPSPPVQPSTQSPAAPEIDYDKLAALILEKAKENPEAFRGPPGPAGKDGKDGAEGKQGPAGPAGKDLQAKPWYLRTVHPETGEETITEIWPGDTVTLRLFEFPRK